MATCGYTSLEIMILIFYFNTFVLINRLWIGFYLYFFQEVDEKNNFWNIHFYKIVKLLFSGK
jgi:hypothetical protein